MNDLEIEKGFKLIIANAQSLLAEAEVLFQHGFFARAFGLAQLAIEEAGKSMLLAQAILKYYSGQTIDINYFEGQGYLDHNLKTKQSLKAELIAIWLFEQSTSKKSQLRHTLMKEFREVKKMNNLKNDSLYVGLSKKGFYSPKDAVSKEIAANRIDDAKVRVAAAEPLFRPLSEMKSSAERLMALAKNPEEEAELMKKAAKELGVHIVKFED